MPLKKPEAPKALDLDKLLGEPRNRVKRVGVELEGAWNKIPAGAKIDRDGSVFKAKGDEGGLIRTHMPGYKVGEIPMGRMEPAQVPRAMRKYYPQLVDASCGLHVHMSFKTVLQYALLADSANYQETIVEYLKRWGLEEKLPADHHLFSRLKGDFPHCQKKFWPDKQIQTVGKEHDMLKDGHRYTIINYCWRNGTVECRVLPMFDDVEVGIRAVRRVIDITNAYLVVVDKTRPSKGEGKVDVPPGQVKLSLELRDGKIYEEYYEE